jgi:hypothetical protein
MFPDFQGVDKRLRSQPIEMVELFASLFCGSRSPFMQD